MGSLTGCLKTAGTELDATDRDEILARQKELRNEGMKVAEATPLAIREQIAKVSAAAQESASPAKSEAMQKAQKALDDALGDLGDILGKGTRLNMMPEQEQRILPVLTRLFDAAFNMGYLKFKEAAKFVLDKIRAHPALGAEIADAITIDHLQGAYITMAGSHRDEGVSSKKEVVGIEDKAEIEAYTPEPEAQADNAPKETPDVPSPTVDLERDRADAGSGLPNVAPFLFIEPGATVWAGGRPDGEVGSDGDGQPDVPRVPAGRAVAGREPGNKPVHRGIRGRQPSIFDAANSDGERGDDPGFDGAAPEAVAASAVAATADSATGSHSRLTAQRAALSIPVKPGDAANIAATLPYLLPGQLDDVLKAETRFAKAEGYGMLFTNGTGTGKTFSGLGVIRRAVSQGKANILVVVPDGKIAADWIESGQPLGLTITPLKDTKDAGKGLVITTYSNLGQNDELARRDWDMVVADEAHMLMQAADGKDTLALDALRAISSHPRGTHTRHTMLNREEINTLKDMLERRDSNDGTISHADTTEMQREALKVENGRLDKRIGELRMLLDTARKEIEADVDVRQGAKRTRLVALSATPFAYDKAIDWAEGYLFDYREGYPHTETSRGYNVPDPHDYFFITHLGWRMRTGKLNEPDAKVNRGLMRRQFNSWMKKRGALSSRMLDVNADYDRRFILAESEVGRMIDDALAYIRDQTNATHTAIKDASDGRVNGWAIIGDVLRESFYGKTGHLVRRYLLEAIKAKEVVPHIREHMAMGRKIVVFHDFKKGGSVNPFDFRQLPMPEVAENASEGDVMAASEIAKRRAAYNAAADEFASKYPELVGGALLQDLISPLERFAKEFPDALLINGDQKPKDLLARYKRFNDDSTGPLVALVQAAKDKGWSGHDTTGKNQRVLFNLGLPTQPTKTIQQEGRIFRTGQVSDAIFRYLNTGTNWERWAFATTIADRSSAAEDLGVGEEARALKDSFVTAFEGSGDFRAGHEGEGKGGKAIDRAAQQALSDWDRAVTFYFGQQKKTSKTKAQEGADYFATPEPIGLKMVEWANGRGGEDGLEPSGGHGAIARWMPSNMNNTAIEPASGLGSRMSLVFDGKIIQDTFENLHVSNKYDTVQMNPPYGTAGRMAIDHLAKAATHLRDGGRIVALIPDGPSANDKFDKWFYEETTRPLKPVATIDIGMGPQEVFVGDMIKASRSWLSGRLLGITSGGVLRVKTDGTGETMVHTNYVESVARTGNRTETYRPASGLHLVAEIKLPPSAFERAGTQVRTRIVVIDRIGKDGEALQGPRIDLSDVENITELFARMENMDVPKRTKAIAVEVPEVAARGPVELGELEEFAESAEGGAVLHMANAVKEFKAGRPNAAGRIVAYAAHASDSTQFKTQAKKMMKRLAAMRVSRTPATPRPDEPAADQATTRESAKVEAAAAGAEIAGGAGLAIVEHVTQKGKTLTGYIARHLTKTQAQEISPYTWAKDGGFFIRSEHIPLMMEKYPPPGAASVNEPEAAYLQANEPDAYTADLFGEPIPAPARANRVARPAIVKRAADDKRTPALPADTPVIEGEFYTRTIVGSAGTRKLGARIVTNASQAAAATQYLGASAVERFDGLVVDKDGKPLAMIGGFKGALSQTSVYPATLVGEAMRIEGAAAIWFSHNHPSGISTLSRADESLYNNLFGIFEGTGIKTPAMLAIGNGEYSASLGKGGTQESGKIPAGLGSVSVPAIERELSERGVKGAITDPTGAMRHAKAFYAASNGPGMILLDSQHQIVGWVPVSGLISGRLRNTGGLDALYRAVSEANAGAVIFAHKGELDGKVSYLPIVNNIAGALKGIDVRTLDVVNVQEGTSAANKGELPLGGTFLSRGTGAHGGLDVDVLADWARAIAAKWVAAPTVKVVANVASLPPATRAQLRSMGADGNVRALVLPEAGEVYLIADRMTSMAEAQEALFHEVYGHFGLRSFMGASYESQLALLKIANPALKAEARAWLLANGAGEIAVRVQRGMSAADAAREVQFLSIEEALSDRAGKNQPVSGWDRFMAALQKSLRSIGFDSLANMLEGMSQAETLQLLANARAAVQSGAKAAAAGGQALSRAEEAPIWYSDLYQKIDAATMKAAPAPQWSQFINGLTQKGVKPDEIEWSGVHEWLALQPGKVTKDALAEFLATGGVRIKEVTLGEPVDAAETLNLSLEGTGYTADANNVDGELEFVDPDGDLVDYADLPEKVQRIVDDHSGKVDGVTKYGTYTLPGGTKYREVLLTLPPKTEKVKIAIGRGPYEARKSAGMWYLVDRYGEWGVTGYESRAIADSMAPGAEEKTVDSYTTRPYDHSHWADHMNVLAHIRLNDRVDADGRRVLFVEEIQSDWAQEGKRKGIAGAFPSDVLKAAVAGGMAEPQARADIKMLMDNPLGTEDVPTREPWTRLIEATKDSGIDLNVVFHDQRDEGVPNAPFIGKTDAWVGLALRRVIKMAVDGGYDKVAFVTGQQSADRYDLSKQLSELSWQVSGDKVVLGAKQTDGQPVDFGSRDNAWSPDELDGVVGKEIADRIREAINGGTKWGVYRSLDLKVGGEGMIAFYDKIVPAAAKDVLKKLGGAGLVPIDLKLSDMPWSEYEKYPVDHPYRVKNAPRVNGFDITPAMRQKAAGGVPLFSRSPGVRASLAKAIAATERFDAVEKAGDPTVGADDYFALAEKVAKAKDELGAELLSRPADEFAVQGIARGGRKVIVAGSAQNPGQWQITRFGTDGQPWGDSQYTTQESAITDFLREVDLVSLRDVDGAIDTTQSEAFRAWFGSSKVVDSDGKPLVVYHGTKADITRFDSDAPRARQAFTDAQGFYFTKHADDAGNYAGIHRASDGGANVVPVYVKLLNPKRITSADGFMQHPSYISPTRRAELEAQGYDGIIYNDGDEIVAFRPEQIKSATGNSGAFDPSSPSILLSRKPSHTPEQTEALARAGIAGKKGLADTIRGAWASATGMLAARDEAVHHFQQGALDQFHGINRAVKESLGGLPVDQDPYIAARLANGGASSVMRGLLLHGQAKWAANGQHLEKIDGTKGLLDILTPLGEDINDWFGWMVGNRAARLKAEGRENNLTDAQILALKSLATPENSAAFKAASVQYAAFKRSVLDVAQGAGLIDPESRKVWDHADYIPFYREIDRNETLSGISKPGVSRAAMAAIGKKGLAGQSSGIRTLRGGEAKLNDPMENVLMNFSRLIDASLKNNAIRKTVDAFQGTGWVEKVGYAMSAQIIPREQVRRLLIDAGTPEPILDVIPEEAFDGMAKMWAIQPPADPDVVRVMRGGKPEFYRVNDPLMLKSLTSFVPFDFPGLGVARFAKRLLTRAVTITPEFMLRNYIRDAIATRMIAKDGIPIGGGLRGLAKSFKESGAFEAMLYAGASFQSGNVNAGDPERTGVEIRKALRRRGMNAATIDGFMATVLDSPAKMLEQYERIGSAVENASREAVYEAATKSGKSATAAAFEAKDLMDFSLRGSSALYQVMADVLPFFNARVQGLYRLGRVDPKRLAVYATAMTMFSTLLAMLNGGDDRYEEIPDWDKDTYWHFWLAGGHFRIPKPFELGAIFGTIPERIVRAINGEDPAGKLAKRIASVVGEQLAMDPVPQLLRPGLNVYANWDNFRDAPIETMSDEGKLPAQRYTARTSDTARVAVGAVEPLANKVGLSPKRLEYLIGGYLGTTGMYALALTDMAVRLGEDKPATPAWRADDIPVVKVFYRVDPSRATVYESDLYAMRSEIEDIMGSYRALLREGQTQQAADFHAAHKEELMARGVVAGGAKALAGFRRQADAVYSDPTLTPAEKRDRLDAINVKKNAVAKQAMDHPAVKALQ